MHEAWLMSNKQTFFKHLVSWSSQQRYQTAVAWEMPATHQSFHCSDMPSLPGARRWEPGRLGMPGARCWAKGTGTVIGEKRGPESEPGSRPACPEPHQGMPSHAWICPEPHQGMPSHAWICPEHWKGGALPSPHPIVWQRPEVQHGGRVCPTVTKTTMGHTLTVQSHHCGQRSWVCRNGL